RSHPNLCAAVSTSTVQPGRGRPLQVHAPDLAPPRRCRESGRRGLAAPPTLLLPQPPGQPRAVARDTRALPAGDCEHRGRPTPPRASSRTGWPIAVPSWGGEPALLVPAVAHALLDPDLPRHLCSTRVPSVEGWVRRATELPPRQVLLLRRARGCRAGRTEPGLPLPRRACRVLQSGKGRRYGGRRGRRAAGRASLHRCFREMGREGRERGANGEPGDLRARPKRRLQCRSGSLIRLHPHRPIGAHGDGRHLLRLLLATSGPAPSMGCNGSLIHLPPHRLTGACDDGRHLLRLLLAVYHPRSSTTSTRA
ncbi:unnamed protein product, partial [Urochloa humidicola]